MPLATAHLFCQICSFLYSASDATRAAHSVSGSEDASPTLSRRAQSGIISRSKVKALSLRHVLVRIVIDDENKNSGEAIGSCSKLIDFVANQSNNHSLSSEAAFCRDWRTRLLGCCDDMVPAVAVAVFWRRSATISSCLCSCFQGCLVGFVDVLFLSSREYATKEGLRCGCC